MINNNTVRNTVMDLLSKNNKGYLTPAAYDSYSRMAQIDLFEELFFKYNKWLNQKNARLSNAEYADIPKNIKQQIDVFSMYSTPSNFVYDSGEDLYNFTDTDLYREEGFSLKNAAGKLIDIEEVSKGAELNKLINSTINAPTFTFPIYVKQGKSYRFYPKLTAGYSIEMLYIREPKDPKWTYQNVDGNPMFNAGASDRQDFELDISMLPLLVSKILAYAGLELRETEVVQIASAEENSINQNQA